MLVVRSTLAGLALLSLSSPALAESAPRPKLIVALAVDQFSADILTEYRGQFTGGFKRLMGGAVFPRGHQGHAATETCPGHSTILTGSRPARTGIIANDWQNPAATRTDKAGKPNFDVYCAENPGAVASDYLSSSSGYVVSPNFLKVPTLGDRMKVVDPKTRVVSVSLKDRAAVMMGGHNTDVALWWDGKAFVTFVGNKGPLPSALPAINASLTAEIAKDATQKLPAFCQRYSRPIKMNDKITVGVLQTRKGGQERAWRASAAADAATLKVALAALSEMKLGKGDSTDLLAISFSATDYVGHTYGTEGAEMCTQILALDGILGQLFSALDKSGMSYAVSLTADHGGHDMPERNRTLALPAAERVEVSASATYAGQVVAKQLGLSGSALLGRSTFGDMYLSPSVPADKRAAALDAAVAYYRAHKQVEAVFTKAELSATPAPSRPVDEWSLIERAKASFDPERSGDFIVLLKPYVTPIPDTNMGYFATHGSPWGYDRRVPILFWWKGMTGFEQPNAVETVDILPTWASLIGLSVPKEEIDGRCLDLVAGNGNNCGG